MNTDDLLARSSYLSQIMFPDITKTPEDYEEIFPERVLKSGENSYVTRISPSPTGYLHIGTLYISMIDLITARQSGGVFYFRLEDTDRKREVEGGADDIISGMVHYGIRPDEGYVNVNEIKGDYGPYKQSDRVEIYQTYVKSLIQKGLAYPCFCSEEQRQEDRQAQESAKARTGYYGEFARCRCLGVEDAIKRIEDKESFVVRLRSFGSEETRFAFTDVIRGKIEMPENDEDIVILKSDGIPTYHFAHAIDDHLMRTTHVIRGDEWLSSVPKHIQLFKTLGFKPPKYAHVSPIMKEENGNRRKISKRKDPEAAIHFYAQQGYTKESVIEYLMTIASSEFEQWRRHNPDKSFLDFDFKLKKMSISGALFDIDKLNDVSKTVISGMSAEDVSKGVLEWAESFNPQFFSIISSDKNYLTEIFKIDRGGKKPRKDIAKWDETPAYTEFFYDETFKPVNLNRLHDDMNSEKITVGVITDVLSKYVEVYNENDDKQEWFDRIKALCPSLGFCPEVKEYKADPDQYKGHVGDLTAIIRIALTGRQNSPDLHSIMQLLGKERITQRLSDFL